MTTERKPTLEELRERVERADADHRRIKSAHTRCGTYEARLDLLRAEIEALADELGNDPRYQNDGIVSRLLRITKGGDS
jgi:hypothetical protein